MIADPALVGATHESVTCESPAMLVGTEIAAGGVSGVMAVEAGEKAPVPTTLMAATLK